MGKSWALRPFDGKSWALVPSMGKYWVLMSFAWKILALGPLNGKILGPWALQWENSRPWGPSQQSKAHIDHHAGAFFCTCSTSLRYPIQPCAPSVHRWQWQQCLPACLAGACEELRHHFQSPYACRSCLKAAYSHCLPPVLHFVPDRGRCQSIQTS